MKTIEQIGKIMKKYILCFIICCTIIFGILFINLIDVSFAKFIITLISSSVVSLLVTFVYALITKIFGRCK